MFKLPKYKSDQGGSTAPPRRGRRTPKHLKGKGYPGQWITTATRGPQRTPPRVTV